MSHTEHIPEPENWLPTWRHLPLFRKTADKPRRPWYPLPDRIPESDAARLASSRACWNGIQASWDSLLELVEHEGSEGRHSDVGLIPSLNDLVIFDCDVKYYSADTSALNWQANRSNHVRFDDLLVEKRGIDDLAREVANLGHSISEIATYAVETKSGGHHLYFRQNPFHRINTTRHHRHDWRIDVIASPNNWVAAPPTPGYRVARDLPVLEIPLWLATWVDDINQNLPGISNGKQVSLSREIRDTRMSLAESMITADRTDLFRRWVNLELNMVVIANEDGGWNMSIYQCTRNLLDGGISDDAVTRMVLTAAQPVNASEERGALDTIRSAIHGHGRKDRAPRNERRSA